MLEHEELLEILKEISPAQYMVLYNSWQRSQAPLDQLLTEWYILEYPDKAVSLFERYAKRVNIDAIRTKHIEAVKEYIKNRKLKEQYPDRPSNMLF